MAERKVKCIKLGQELPGLEKPPFPGPLGEKIYEQISKEAWEAWKEVQVRLLNEYRLNMADAKDHQVMLEQMQYFLNMKTPPAATEKTGELDDPGPEGKKS